jgi:acyl-ACP thioesterase
MTAAEPNADTNLVPIPTSGRTFTTTRVVSIADANPDGRMEFDAIGRFLQDAGNADTDDANLPELGLAWVARRCVIDIHHHGTSREELQLTTWCSGTGARWAERRTSIRGSQGAHVEAAAIWVHIDAETGRPTKWGEEFANAYLQATGGRQVDSRLRHPKRAPAAGDDGVNTMEFRFRQTDMDAFRHVNNAAYLSILEEALGGNAPPAPLRLEIEWRKPSLAGEVLTVVETIGMDGVQQWITADDEVRATIAARPLT